MNRFLLTVAALAMMAMPANAADDVTTYQLQAEFDDVAADVNDGIVNRGYVIDYRGYIGDMLKRTAADVAQKQIVYGDGLGGRSRVWTLVG